MHSPPLRVSRAVAWLTVYRAPDMRSEIFAEGDLDRIEKKFRKSFTAAEQLLAAQPLCAQDKFDLLLCLRQLPTSVVREIVGYTAR